MGATATAESAGGAAGGTEPAYSTLAARSATRITVARSDPVACRVQRTDPFGSRFQLQLFWPGKPDALDGPSDGLQLLRCAPVGCQRLRHLQYEQGARATPSTAYAIALIDLIDPVRVGGFCSRRIGDARRGHCRRSTAPWDVEFLDTAPAPNVLAMYLLLSFGEEPTAAIGKI
jgi:hypothetical protein